METVLEEKTIKEKTINGMIWRFLDYFFTQGITTIVAIVLTRILMPSDYGIVSAAFIFISICDTFASEGFTSALIQKKDADQLDFSSIFYTALVSLTVLYLVLFFSAPYITQFFGQGYELLTPVLRVLCLRIPLTAFSVIQQAYISRHLMFKKMFWMSSVGTLASAFIGIGMALCGAGPWALVGQYLSDAVIDTVIFSIAVKWRPARCYSWQRTRKMLSFSINLLAAGLLDTLFENLRSAIIGHRYQSSSLAFFDKGRRFPHIIVSSINNSLMAVLYPVMAKMQDNKKRLLEAVRKTIKISTYTLFPCMFGFAAVAEPFVSLVLTDKWLPCVPYLKVFCFYYAFYPTYTASMHATKAMGKSGVYVLTQMSKKVVDLVCLLITAPFGVYWIAIGALGSKFFVYIINGISAKITLGYPLRRQFLDILPNLLLAAVMYGAVELLPVSSGSKVVILAVKCLTGCAVYILLSIVFRNEGFFFLWEIIKKKAAQVLWPHMGRAVKDAFYAGRAMRRYSDCLDSGIYCINPTKNIIYRRDIKSAEAQEDTFLYKTKERQSEISPFDEMISRIYRGCVGKGNKKFNGQLLMITSSKREMKLFDYTGRKIATVYQETQEAEAGLKNRVFWSSYFPVVPFETDIRDNMLIETMVEKRPYDSESAFFSTFSAYIHYVKVQKGCGGFTQLKYDKAPIDRFLNLLGRSGEYDEFRDILKMPALMAHGDLWPSNIIYDGETFFHIDFEHMAVRIFFFDLLMYVFSDCRLNKNSTLLDKYMQGEYDARMEDLFCAAGCVYQRSKRLLYLEAVIFQLFLERWDQDSPDAVMGDMRALVDHYGPRRGKTPEVPERMREWENLPPDFSIAVTGVDGTGKSTLVESLGRYYGYRAYTQYMGFRPSSFVTLPARMLNRMHGLHPLLRHLHLYTSLYMLTSWYEMKYRLRQAHKNEGKLIIFDRYCWEMNDNVDSPYASYLSNFLFHKHFPSPTGVIYLHCPAGTSMERKDDILDQEAFIRMKEHTDQIYKERPDILVIDTSVNTAEQVKSMAVEYIDKLLHGRNQ